MQNLQPKIDINQTFPVECEKCNGMYFEEALHIRKASGILTGTGQLSYIPIPVFKCISCSHINSEFLPKEIKSLSKDEE